MRNIVSRKHQLNKLVLKVKPYYENVGSLAYLTVLFRKTYPSSLHPKQLETAGQYQQQHIVTRKYDTTRKSNTPHQNNTHQHNQFDRKNEAYLAALGGNYPTTTKAVDHHHNYSTSSSGRKNELIDYTSMEMNSRAQGKNNSNNSVFVDTKPNKLNAENAYKVDIYALSGNKPVPAAVTNFIELSPHHHHQGGRALINISNSYPADYSYAVNSDSKGEINSKSNNNSSNNSNNKERKSQLDSFVKDIIFDMSESSSVNNEKESVESLYEEEEEQEVIINRESDLLKKPTVNLPRLDNAVISLDEYHNSMRSETAQAACNLNSSSLGNSKEVNTVFLPKYKFGISALVFLLEFEALTRVKSNR